MDLKSIDCPSGLWPVYKGASFNLWEPDTGKKNYYAWVKNKNKEVMIFTSPPATMIVPFFVFQIHLLT